MRSEGEPPGPELTEGAPIDAATPARDSTVDGAGCAGPGIGAGSAAGPVEERLGAASVSVTRALDDVFVAVRTLVGTEEGHRFIGAQVDRAGETIASLIRDFQGWTSGPPRK